jgi:hypothetical protein
LRRSSIFLSSGNVCEASGMAPLSPAPESKWRRSTALPFHRMLEHYLLIGDIRPLVARGTALGGYAEYTKSIVRELT